MPDNQIPTNNSLTYKDSGVDTQAGQNLIQRIKPFVKQTHRPEVVGQIGGFGGLFQLPDQTHSDSLLVAGTDGVGTKLKLAIDYDRHDTIGEDLVAMCVNDILVLGAEPLFFLDYFATGKLNVDHAAKVIESIANGCKMANMALLGGETAEMPGMYQKDDYDLAGFAVGMVSRAQLIDGTNIQAGDTLIAIESSGIHSNGYSLVRKILEQNNINPNDVEIDGNNLMDLLIKPTYIYAKALKNLLQTIRPKGIAHITGGGVDENLPRCLPDTLSATINTKSYTRPALFDWLQDQGKISDAEMWKTFNQGIGMILVVKPSEAEKTMTALSETSTKSWILGQIIPGCDSKVVYES